MTLIRQIYTDLMDFVHREWIQDSRFKIQRLRPIIMRIYANKKLGHSVPQCITVFHSVIRSQKTLELRPPDASCRNSFIQQNQGIHGSHVETWHAASLLVACRVSTGGMPRLYWWHAASLQMACRVSTGGMPRLYRWRIN